MSFLSSETIKKYYTHVIDNFDANRVKYGAYELSLGSEAITSDDKEKKIINDDKFLIIPPGQFALLITKERITIPNNLIAFISIKYTFKKKGLINISGFHVDPGFDGKLKYSVYNAGSKNIYLKYGQPLFPIWFSKLDSETKNFYDGDHKNQESLDNKDAMEIEGNVVSPSVLKQEIDKLKNELQLIKQIGLIIIAALIPILFGLTKGGCNCAPLSQPTYKIYIDSTKFQIDSLKIKNNKTNSIQIYKKK